MANNNPEESNTDWIFPYRREVMKAVGAGTALGMIGGTAMADEHDENDELDPEEDDENDIDDENDDVETNTVHVVRTLITEPTNPERPADFFYQPTGLHVEPGDVVKFVFETPDHTVTSYHPAFGMQRRIPAGVQPFSSPILGWEPDSLPEDIDMPLGENGEHVENDIDENNQNANDETETEDENDVENGVDDEEGPRPSVWMYAFETPGVYDIECAPHEMFGMAMRVVVGDETETTFETSDPDELLPPRAGPVEMARQVLTDPQLEPETIVEEGYVEWMDLEMNDPDEDENDVDEVDDENGNDDVDDENGDGE